MSFYDAIRVGSSGDAEDFEVERSLRFYDLANNYLDRTPSSTSNRNTWTFSAWVKRSNITTGTFQTLFSANNSSNYGLYGTYIWFTTTDTLAVSINSGIYYLNTNAKFRDVSAWYHLVVAVDTTQATDSNRIKVYVNGVQETSFATSTYPTQNLNTSINLNQQHTIGARRYSSIDNYFNGYIAEINFIDGQQLTPASFAETNSTTGQWIPKDTSALTFGTNGFRLKFNDNSNTTATTLGKDSSGNGNNYTPNNFYVAVGSAVNVKNKDSVLDTPTNNFPVLNPLNFNPFGVSNYVASSPVNGNLAWVTNTTSNVNYAESTMFFPNTGKWYLEVYVNNLNIGSGVGYTQITVYGDTGGSRYLWWQYSSPYYQIITNSSSETIGSISNGDIIQVAYDSDTGNVWFGKNNTWYLSGDPANGTAMSPATTVANDYAKLYVGGRSGSAQNTLNVNFGQQGFLYTPPTGFKAISSKNIPTPTILLPNQHFNTVLYTGNGSTTQNITGYNFQPDWVWIKSRSSGSGHHSLVDSVRGDVALNSDQTIAEYSVANFNFNATSIDVPYYANNYSMNTNAENYVAWNWNAGGSASKTYRVVVSSAGGSGNKYRFRNSANSATFAADAVTLDLEEGGTYTFDGSDSTMASHPIKLSTTANGTHGGGSSYNTGVTYELDGSTVTESAYVSGYSSATSRKLIITVAASAPTLYYYCHVHSGMGGQINTNSTFGSSNFDGSTQSTVKANTTAGFSIVSYTGTGSNATIGHGLGVAPTSVIVKRRDDVNNWRVGHNGLTDWTYRINLESTDGQSQQTNVWNSTAPSSSVFSIGTSSSVNTSSGTYIAYCFSEVAGYSKFGKYTGTGSTDGAFAYTGFRPAWVLIKSTSGSTHWVMKDTTRDTYNVANKTLLANSSTSEDTSGSFSIDFLSNGFKCRASGTHVNASGTTYIYLAFAESPFKNNRAR